MVRGYQRLTAVTAMVCFLVSAGCNGNKDSQAVTDTTSLLSRASPEICADNSVREALKTLFVYPKHDLYKMFSIPPQDIDTAYASLSVSYSMTSMTDANKSIPKVSCSTTVIIKIDGQVAHQFDVSYTVKKSLDGEEGYFIISDAEKHKNAVLALMMSPLLSEIAASKRPQQAEDEPMTGDSLASNIQPDDPSLLGQ